MNIIIGHIEPYEGISEDYVDLENDDPDYVEYMIQLLAGDEYFLIEYPDLCEEKLGEWFSIYKKDRLEQIKTNRSLGAKKAAATRKKNKS